MPPTADGYLKFIRDIPLANTRLHEHSNSRISVPSAEKEGTEWTALDKIRMTLQREIETTIAGIFGQEAVKDLMPEQVRMCW